MLLLHGFITCDQEQMVMVAHMHTRHILARKRYELSRYIYVTPVAIDVNSNTHKVLTHALFVQKISIILTNVLWMC